MVAPQGLRLNSADPDSAGRNPDRPPHGDRRLWATQRLDGLIRDADSRLGGLLFLYDATGKRHIANISTAVIPKFD